MADRDKPDDSKPRRRRPPAVIEGKAREIPRPAPAAASEPKREPMPEPPAPEAAAETPPVRPATEEAARPETPPSSEIPRLVPETPSPEPEMRHASAGETQTPPPLPRNEAGGRAMMVAAGAALAAGVAGIAFGAWWFAPPPPASVDLSGVRQEISQLGTRLADLDKAARQTPDLKPQLAPLVERGAQLDAALAALRDELAAVKRAASERPAPPAAPADDALKTMIERLAAIESRIEALAQAAKTEPPPAIAPDKTDPPAPKSETPPEAPPAAKADVPPAPVTPAPEMPPAPKIPAAAELAALGLLRDAVASGKPYRAEFDAVRALMQLRGPLLDPLAAAADTGVVPVAVLAQRFEILATTLAREPQSGDGVLDRLWNQATRLVEVRPAGEPRGNSRGAVVARMETKLARGDLDGALKDSEALPEDARAAAREWFVEAARRRDTDTLMKALIADALNATKREAVQP